MRIYIPLNPPKNFLGEDIFQPVTPNIAKLNEKMSKKNEPSNDPMAQMMASIGISNPEADKSSRTYASWLQWWKSTVSSDDYMKYLSTLESDYMGAVFHFYDSGDESDDEDEDLTARGRFLSRKSHASQRGKITSEQREKQRKINELKQIKSEFKEGFWNANAVLMGGLGKDPELADDAAEDKDKPADRQTRSKESSHSTSKTFPQRQSQNSLFPEGKRDLFSRMSKATATNSEVAGSVSEQPAEEIKKPAPPQERLEAIWSQLHMPDSLRLDMAIKYSCNNHFTQLNEAIERWELVTELVLQREALLVKLEKFERDASDPNRFFNKDSKKSTYRLNESKRRAYFSKRIDALDVEIKEEIEFIKDQFQDNITFKGRPYMDKMKWDRTEMLYWLSEERKQQGLHYEAMSRGINLPLRHAQLKPITPAL